MAVATAAALGVDAQTAADRLRDIVSVAGRYAVLDHDGRRTRLMLAKNPAGWVEALSVVASGTTPLVLAFNSDGVDGRDPSWLYDVPFAGIAGRQVVVTGRRATDMLVRLEMDGLTDVRRAPDALARRWRCCPRGRSTWSRTTPRSRTRDGSWAMPADSEVAVVLVYPEVLGTYGDRGNALALAAPGPCPRHRLPGRRRWACTTPCPAPGTST